MRAIELWWTPEEVARASEIGSARFQAKTRKSDRTVLGWDRSESLNQMAVLSEILFERLTGLEMNREIIRKGDKGIDFVFGSLTIDLKVADNRRRDYGLNNRIWIVPAKSGNLATRSDLYVLAELRKHSMLFRGWTTSYVYGHLAYKVKRRRHNRNSNIAGFSYAMDARHLYDMLELTNGIRRHCGLAAPTFPFKITTWGRNGIKKEI